MEKSAKTSGILASALIVTSFFCLSAFADSRHRNETWRAGDDRGRYERDPRRNDDRDFVSGVVERVDRRRGMVVLRDRRGGRVVTVAMVRRDGNRAGIDVENLRRGDRVTFVGDWSRRGVFQAWRIDDVDNRSGRRR